MFDIWMILVHSGILALFLAVALIIPGKLRRIGFIILAGGAALVCTGTLRARHVNNVTMSVANAYQQLQNGMNKVEVQGLLGAPDLIAHADPTGKLQVPWGQKWLDIPGASLAWEYRPHSSSLHCYRAYFDGNDRVIGKAAD